MTMSQFETVTEKPPINLLGPYRVLVKLTGLDCSNVAKAREGKASKPSALVSQILAFFVIFILIFRTAVFYRLGGKTLSVGWAESNYFFFMGLHSIVCAFCLYGWTKNSFIPKYTQVLEQVRTMRILENDQLDAYSALHLKCAIISVPLLFAVMFTAIYAAFHGRLTYSSKETSLSMYLAMTVLAFFVWLIVSLCIAFIAIVQISLEQEIVYFNKELQKASDEKELTDVNVFNSISKRQIELIKLVKLANSSLGSYIRFGPLFCGFSVVNSIYITGFISQLPISYFICFILLLNFTIGICIIVLKAAGAVQDALTATSEILLLNESLEKSENQQIYQIYRIMVDRSLRSATKMYILNGVPVVTPTVGVFMLIVPNIGGLLLLLKKVLVAYGIEV